MDAGADPNLTDDNGDCPLHLAAVHGGWRVVRALLEGGADPHRPANDGRNALTLALDRHETSRNYTERKDCEVTLDILTPATFGQN